MGFYIRKSISAGPFRFNLSGAGLGMSVGVKGFRVGSGPRGNYVHMGRGGLYYRASLGGGVRNPKRTVGSSEGGQSHGVSISHWNIAVQLIEIGNVLDMVPANGSEILKEINEKLSRWYSWPWVAIGCLWLSGMVGEHVGLGWVNVLMWLFTIFGTIVAARWDQTRKSVVIMYDIDDEALPPFRAFSEEVEKLKRAECVWNVATSQNTADWKRNAGAGRLLTRKPVTIGYGTPRFIKTNVSIPCIVGGKQDVYFFPDMVLVMENKQAGALTYEQFGVVWDTTVFIEEEAVPSDAQVVGYTWQFVNKSGGPDRRFNNNRQIPKLLYQQMGLAGTGSFRKLLHLSCVGDRSTFDAALNGMRAMVKQQALLSLEPPRA